ncbi:hypothetical protein Hanom_Chr16g01427031 [Helianthus anomalus]
MCDVLSGDIIPVTIKKPARFVCHNYHRIIFFNLFLYELREKLKLITIDIAVNS